MCLFILFYPYLEVILGFIYDFIMIFSLFLVIKRINVLVTVKQQSFYITIYYTSINNTTINDDNSNFAPKNEKSSNKS